RHVDDHRPDRGRRPRCPRPDRQRHEPARRPERLRDDRPRTERRPGDRAARLLLDERAHHLRVASAAAPGGRLSDEDQVTYGGTWVVNPSGGLLSKGHPPGATGLAQCYELTRQLL